MRIRNLKKYLIISIPLIIIAIGITLFLPKKPINETGNNIIKNDKIIKKEIDSLPRCLKFHSGNISVEVEYPEFVYQKLALDPNTGEKFYPEILLINSNPNYEDTVLSVDASSDYDSIQNIIKYSYVEPGPKYIKSNFNGYDAAYSKVKYDTGILNIYKIPFGNRTISISYITNGLSKTELSETNKMVKDIKLTKDTKNLDRGKDYIEHCDN